MTRWTDDELRRVGDATELRLASRRCDGSLRLYVTMWVVRVHDDLYVRSAGGPGRPWYRHALASGRGHIWAGGIETDVTFCQAGDDIQAAIDAAYHDKYDQYGARIVGSVVGHNAHRVTIRLEREGNAS